MDSFSKSLPMNEIGHWPHIFQTSVSSNGSRRFSGLKENSWN